MSPIIKNVGSNLVTFTFPPGNGDNVPIPPSGTVYIPTTKESTTPPKSMELVFREGAGGSYRTVLEWRLIPANITINVGNGDAVIVNPGIVTTTTKAPAITTQASTTFDPAVGSKTTAAPKTVDPAVGTTFDPAVGPQTTTPSPTTFDPAVGPITKTTTSPTTTIDPAVGPISTAKNYYFNPTFINSGSSDISFTIKFANNPTGKIPVNSQTSININQTTPNSPSAINVQFTEGSNTFGINIPWSESPAPVYVQVGSGVAKIVTDGSLTMITPAPQSLKTYYMKTSITNVGPVDVNYYLNSTEGKTGTVPTTSTATIGQTVQSTTRPSPSEIMFFEGSKSYSVPLQWSESEAESMNTIRVGNGEAVVVSGGGGSSNGGSSTSSTTSGGSSGGGSSSASTSSTSNTSNSTAGGSGTSSSTGATKIYSIQPIVQNTGFKEVTFKFPPSVGQTLTLPPFQTINNLQANSSSTTHPPDMVLEFTEGSGNDAKTYTATLPWSGFPIVVTVGDGKADIGTVSKTQPQRKYKLLARKTTNFI